MMSAVNRLDAISRMASLSTSTRKHNGKYRAVIFDMGGVVVPGPGKVFRGKMQNCCYHCACIN